MWFWFWSDIISAMIYPDTELRHGCLCNFYLMCIVCNSAGVSPGETPPPEGRENCFLNFLTTFLVVTLQQVNLQAPLSALSRFDYFFAPTWHFTTIWSPFTPVWGPLRSGIRGRGWSAPALLHFVSFCYIIYFCMMLKTTLMHESATITLKSYYWNKSSHIWQLLDIYQKNCADLHAY